MASQPCKGDGCTVLVVSEGRGRPRAYCPACRVKKPRLRALKARGSEKLVNAR